MERVITIKGRVGRYNVPSFTFTENEKLLLRFNITEHRVGKYKAVISCGKEKKKLTLKKDTCVEILPEFIQKGEYQPICVSLEFRHAQTDKLLIPSNPKEGGFFIEPLVVEQVNEDLTAQGWLTAIEMQLEALQARLRIAENKLKQYEDEGVPLLISQEE